jgi:hypothetical protein
LLWVSGSLVALVAIGLVALIVDGGDRPWQDKLIQQRPSPDGKSVAEIHIFTTRMWGGPDTLYVSIRDADRPRGAKVYTRTYECDDLSAFDLKWQTPTQLTIRYGECNASYVDDPQTNAQQNKVWQSEDNWDGVAIQYADAKYKARR